MDPDKLIDDIEREAVPRPPTAGEVIGDEDMREIEHERRAQRAREEEEDEDRDDLGLYDIARTQDKEANKPEA